MHPQRGSRSNAVWVHVFPLNAVWMPLCFLRRRTGSNPCARYCHRLSLHAASRPPKYKLCSLSFFLNYFLRAHMVVIIVSRILRLSLLIHRFRFTLICFRLASCTHTYQENSPSALAWPLTTASCTRTYQENSPSVAWPTTAHRRRSQVLPGTDPESGRGPR